MSALQEAKPMIPKKHDKELALKSSKALAAVLPKKEKDVRMSVKFEHEEKQITFPFSAIKLLLDILDQMAEGNAVTLIPIHAELTTQEAANLLNVSRPYLIKLLDNKELPFHKVGTHRRIRFVDLLEFKDKVQKESEKALEELVEQAQHLNMGY